MPKLFVDQLGEPYAGNIVRDYVETIAIGSSRFKDWVIKTCYDYRKEEQLKQLHQEQPLYSQSYDLHLEQGEISKPINGFSDWQSCLKLFVTCFTPR